MKPTKHDRTKLESLFDKKGTGKPPGGLEATRAALGDIRTAPKAFQPRDHDGADERDIDMHAEGLASVPRGGGLLDRILVIPIAGWWWVLDGHCRLAAYEKAKWGKEVPIEPFLGTVWEGFLEGARRNNKNHLNLSVTAKGEIAWEVVLEDPQGETYSLSHVAEVSGVSRSTVKNMRDLMKVAYPDYLRGDLMSDALPPARTWSEEKERRRGESADWTEEERDAATLELAKKLRSHFGHQMDRAPDLFIDALSLASSRVWDKMLESARVEVGEE